MSVDDGGPAFPLPLTEQDGTDWNRSGGMSLRDYFAAKVMAAHVTNSVVFNTMTWEEAAEMAYKAADAMLKARNQPTSP